VAVHGAAKGDGSSVEGAGLARDRHRGAGLERWRIGRQRLAGLACAGAHRCLKPHKGSGRWHHSKESGRAAAAHQGPQRALQDAGRLCARSSFSLPLSRPAGARQRAAACPHGAGAGGLGRFGGRSFVCGVRMLASRRAYCVIFTGPARG
jgi:hypothetical protein